MLHIIHALALLFSLSIVVDGVTFSMIFKVPRIEDKCSEKVWSINANKTRIER